MKQKVVLITGSSSGMGKETALFLAKKGFKVYAGTRNPDKATELQCELKKQKLDIRIVKLDVCDNLCISEAIKQIENDNQTIDVLINNAGYGFVSTVEDATEEEMINQFNVNVFGVLRVSKAVIPIMRKQNSGIIINISSFLGKIGLPLLTFYNSSKYAVEGITDSLRYELASFNIRVHSIMPGFFNTNFAKENLITNLETFTENSPYAFLANNLAPRIVNEINHGNDPLLPAKLIFDIINDEKFPARATVGDKAQKFIPMRKELSDEDFERRVKEYYNL